MKKTKNVTKIDLDNIQNPNYVKNLSFKELDVLSQLITNEIIDKTALNGGHLSSNLGVVDATVSLCKAFDFDKDKIVFDVGHQTYAYKILTGRSLERLRKVDGPSGFQRTSESKYDHFEAGHSSTSIAVANGLAIARDLNKEHYDVIAFIGDSSLANGLAFESLNDVALQKHKLIIVLNDNGMSISKPVGGMSKIFRKFSTSGFYNKSKNIIRKILVWNPVGRFIYRIFVKIKNWFKKHLLGANFFESLGFAVIGPVDGHNIKALTKAFQKAKKQTKTTIVHIKTVKGKGYEYAEIDNNGSWHGVAPFDKYTGQPLKETKGYQWADIYSSNLLEEMKHNDKIITLVPGTALGSYINKVKQEFNKRTIDVGIAEEYAVTMAGGLSISGYHPVISIYSTFLQRAYDQISHDLARINLNATFLIDRAGFVGEDGNSHQGIYDEAFLMTIPNTVVCVASNSGQCASLFKESLNNHGVFCIRFSKERTLNLDKDEIIPFGSWKQELLGNSKIAVVSVGPDTEILKELINDKNVTLLNAIYQKPMDMSFVEKLVSMEKVIIYDSMSVKAGFPEHLAATLIEKGFKGELIIKAIPDEFISHASIKEQKTKYGLLPEDIAKIL
jgi:1-deoxy-D-xylulose-5-phosphate synthase